MQLSLTTSVKNDHLPTPQKSGSTMPSSFSNIAESTLHTFKLNSETSFNEPNEEQTNLKKVIQISHIY